MALDDTREGRDLSRLFTETPETVTRLRAVMAGEAPLEGLDENLIHDGAHWTAEGPRGSLWIIRWNSGTGNVTTWRTPTGRVSFRRPGGRPPGGEAGSAPHRRSDRRRQDERRLTWTSCPLTSSCLPSRALEAITEAVGILETSDDPAKES